MKKSMIGIGAVLAFFLACGPVLAQGNEIYGCYQKADGQLRIVGSSGACRPSEVAVRWSKTGPQGPQGPAGPAGPQGPAGTSQPAAATKVEQGPRVFDGKGQFLGVLPSDLEGYLSVFIPSLSRFISLSSSTGGVDPFFPAVYLYFEGDNCTGSSFVDTNLRYQVFRNGETYGRAEDAAAECRDIRSVSSPDWGGGRQCRPRDSGCIPVLPYEEVRLPFALPAVLPFSFEK